MNQILQSSVQDRQHRACIDVVILNYNYREYISVAIESALCQFPYVNKIIVVDDGSTDDSLKVIEKYSDRIRIIKKENGGQISGVVASLPFCESDYVLFLDADDALVSDALKIASNSLVSNPVKVQFQLIGVDTDMTPLNWVFPNYKHSYGREEMKNDNKKLGFHISAPTSGIIFKKEFLLSIDLISLTQKEPIDGTVNLLAPYYGDVISVNQPIAYYRMHDRSLTEWGNYSEERLMWEINRLKFRWREAISVSNDKVQAPDIEETLHVLERRLMISCLRGDDSSWLASISYRRGLRRSEHGRVFRALMALWSILLIVPFPYVQRRLISMRRSIKSRPPLLRAIINRLQKASE